ncbi:MAG: tetraacyldisaccharide 4'-kinase [Verrucomicrobia bacterium]|nr:tetraacyldisaccharide 4'-kinase [Verrucomicrobiota bacterium]MBS0646602.1 tetraacyldisaccharide 4'-kinase [Verrucomicrobiota bacterium]
MWRAWVEGVIAGRYVGVASKLYRTVTMLPSWCFAAAIRGRHLLYDRGILNAQKAAVPVISVGNLVCGGTGKTQFVMLLAHLLMEQGHKVGILSRGYRSDAGKAKYVEPTMSAQQCGDEPLLMARRLPDTCVVVGSDRVRAADLAVAKGAEILLLDDGMQHRRLKRDVEIVLVNEEDDLCAYEYLPRGRLRELPSRLKYADIILYTEKLPLKTRQWTQAPCVEVKIVHDGVFDVTGQPMSVPERVALFCGIGKPQKFVKTVQEMGCEVVKTHFLSDHQKMTKVSLERFSQQAQALGAQALLCTEKDWIKGVCPVSLPVGWVRTKMIVIQGEGMLKSIVERKCV